MIRLNSEEQRLLSDLEALLIEAEPGAESLPTVLGALRDSLKAERAVAYGVDVGPDRYHVSYSFSSGFPQEPGAIFEALDTFMSQRESPWGWYDPARPAPVQRNRALHFRSLKESEAQQMPLHDVPAYEVGRRLGWSESELAAQRERVNHRSGAVFRQLGMERMAFLRTLVCEGPALLGWVGLTREEPFTEREQRLLQALTPTLQRRLTMETRLRESGLMSTALEVAMEALGRAAWVVSGSGRVVHANSAGRVWLERGEPELAEQLKRGAQGVPCSGPLTLTPLRTTGLPAHYLAIDTGTASSAAARVQALAARWSLTARESEVLTHIVQGETNKAIAGRLGCAERTVEVHVTHLLAKAQVESRSALIARFFQSS
ncbi:LuxR C-terminal-related transcriptional regulator [Myxococcus sp. K15C18031901]|uniref:response regulator transcription factor n=1 Tax=Myxococcus dinghuensis TaxID=2906761 RepID=UPI0020A82D1C|nr:helix-turn-helix transcriptional regulator [Myxococcus dinghuensis]MCP3099698.1 LuxR C-terminal-related transcriptional regulator [Myxococcus dinghuensis]